MNSKIKEFQCDGALELTKGVFREFLDNNGISIRISCPHLHQQNGAAERKHGQITEMGNTLLFHASMPKYLWFDAFLSATCLINIIPTKLLQYKCPFEVLFSKVPDYSFLKIFGCMCFPNLTPYRKDKLSPKSAVCVFIGYSPFHKGYRCFDIRSLRVYTTTNVRFNEQAFPFASQNMSTLDIISGNADTFLFSSATSP